MDNRTEANMYAQGDIAHERCVCGSCTQDIMDRALTGSEKTHRREEHKIVADWLDNLAGRKESVMPGTKIFIETNLPNWSFLILESIEKDWVHGQEVVTDRQYH
jgi:hypothetical protein